MHQVLQQLSKINNFETFHLKDDLFNGDLKLINDIKDRISENKPLVVVKHHQYVNFTKYNMKVTTFNLARHPVSRWASAYNYCRGGMARAPAPKSQCINMPQWEVEESIDEHVIRDPWIKQRYSKYLQWIDSEDCIEHNLNVDKNWLEKPLANRKKFETTECIKNKILNSYLTVGILEELEDSLKLFERLMPNLFKDVFTVMAGEDVLTSIKHSKSVRSDKMSNHTFEYLCKRAFRYEVDVYKFLVARFKMQLEKFGLGR